MGVVDYDGNVIVTPEYQKIEYAYRGGDYTMDELVFIAHGNNGIIQVINARNQEKIIESWLLHQGYPWEQRYICLIIVEERRLNWLRKINKYMEEK